MLSGQKQKDELAAGGAASPGNYQKTKEAIGYVDFESAGAETYRGLGFKCGLEIHQQLLTRKKLFCHCPAGLYQKDGQFDAEVIRHMRPTLSEMGEYDGTALMEMRTRKNITYRIAKETACTYDIDDTPPFRINDEALDIALEIAHLLKTNIVGELHITRKQYLDGSIPTGFQRTAIVGVEGEISLEQKKVRIIQLSIEEDACREISDIGHERIYTTDRLGMPLIEIVTYPELLTPLEAAEAGQYLRLLVRTTGMVRTGIGAGRQDVNVSIEGGTRVEIKGVAHIKWIPRLTHNEAFRQKALLAIKSALSERGLDAATWMLSSVELEATQAKPSDHVYASAARSDHKFMAVNLPGFGGLISFFTQPGQCFADEISGRLRVIACLNQPNMLHSEDPRWNDLVDAGSVREILGAGDQDAQLVFWGPAADVKTALETIEERCKMAFDGVPNETRKSLPGGVTIFERVLPGPDRMYPDTDSAPISISDERVENARKDLPADLAEQLQKLREWQVPVGLHRFLIRENVLPVIEAIASETGWDARFVALLIGQQLPLLWRRYGVEPSFTMERVRELCVAIKMAGLDRSIVKGKLHALYRSPDKPINELFADVKAQPTANQLQEMIAELAEQFKQNGRSEGSEAQVRWMMGQLRKRLGDRFSGRQLISLVEEKV